jgi:membrane-associated phospholipid phosphatase
MATSGRNGSLMPLLRPARDNNILPSTETRSPPGFPKTIDFPTKLGYNLSIYNKEKAMEEWLQSLVPWGIEVIVWVQSSSSPFLDAVFRAVTFLGNEEFYLLLLPFIYWCVHKGIGTSLGYLSLLSAWFNDVVKYLFKIPRPGTFDSRVHVLTQAANPSFPSGHAQGAMVNLGYLAYRFRNTFLWVVAILAILSVGLSRIVLGVHFPQDVIGGWLIGLVLLVVYAWAEPRCARWIGRQSTPVQVALAMGIPLLLIFLHPSDMDGLYPAEGSITPMSALAGFGLGVIMERKWVRFRVEGAWWRRSLRFLLGLVIIAILYLGPRFVLPDEMAYGLEVTLRFVRYALVGWATAFLGPWLFIKLGLAEQMEP